MKISKLIVFLFIIPLLSFNILHKNYLSLTLIDYTQKTKALQITMNVFIDDAELALNKTFEKEFKLNTPQELENTDTNLVNYLNDHFKIKVNAKSENYKFIGKEYEGDIVYFYLEIENIKEINSIEVENNTLMDFFPKQQNYIKLKVNGSFESLLLTKDNYKGLLKF